MTTYPNSQDRQIYFMLLSLQGQHELISALLKDADNAHFFIAASIHHGLAGYIYRDVSSLSDRKIFPPQTMGLLQQHYKKQWIRSELISKELLSLLNLLTEKEISEIIVVKGPVFERKYYGDSGYLYINDIDLYARPHMIASIERRLVDAGYKCLSMKPFPVKVIRHFVNQWEYRKDNIIVDLHWDLAHHYSLQLSEDSIWKQKSLYEFKNCPIPCLSPEYELLHKILSAFFDIHLNILRLRSMLDLKVMVETLEDTIDWKHFLVKRKDDKTLAIAVNILDILRRMFPASNAIQNIYRHTHPYRSLVSAANDDWMKIISCRHFGYNKRWSFSLYQSSNLSLWAWWVASLPVRIATHNTSK